MKTETVICRIMGNRGKMKILKDPDSGRWYEGDPALAFIRDVDREKCLKEFDRKKLRRV